MRARHVVALTAGGLTVVCACALGLGVLAADAYVLRLIWRWHIVTMCGVRELTFLHACGLVLMVRLAVRTPQSEADRKASEGLAELTGWALGRVIVAMGFLLIAYGAWLLGGGGHGG